MINMKQRIITALALLALLAVVIWQIYTPVFILVISAFSAIAAYEIMSCARVSNKFIKTIGTIFAFFVPVFSEASILEPLISTDGWGYVTNYIPKAVYLIVLIIAFFLAMLKGYSHTKFEDVAVSVVASVMVPYVFSLFGKLRDLDGYKSQFGILLLFFGLICALATDVGAQLGGMKFGKTKMAPNISPKKTIEGAVCGVIFCLLLNAVALTLYDHLAAIALTAKEITILMVAAPFFSVLGMMGDLTASVLKRNFEVKDFGNIFPGHGGVMDRFDSSLFTVAATYCLAIIVF